MRRHLLAALIGVLALVAPAKAQQSFIDLEITHAHDGGNIPICVPLSLSKDKADLTNVRVQCLTVGSPTNEAQLTAPGVQTEHIKPAAPELIRRDLHLTLRQSFKPGTVSRWTVDLNGESRLRGSKFAWKRAGQFADLVIGPVPVLRYVHAAYDNSTPANRDQTYKVFHHVYDRTGKRFLTNGGDTNERLPLNPKDLLYPHHRGLMYAFNNITFDGNKKCDTWHAKPGDTHQSHQGFLVEEGGFVLGRHRVAVDWHGPQKQVFAKEEREITVYKMDKGTLVEFASRLRTTGGLVKLQGDPQHAGFQFRAHNDLHEQKMDKQTYYLRPDGKAKLGDTRNWDPKTKKGPINLPWDASSFVLDGKRYTVAYLNHPNNPGESRWSERDYGRFGCYFEYDLTEKNPLVVNYRVFLQEGEMNVEEVEALHKAFTQPPKVTVK